MGRLGLLSLNAQSRRRSFFWTDGFFTLIDWSQAFFGFALRSWTRLVGPCSTGAPLWALRKVPAANCIPDAAIAWGMFWYLDAGDETDVRLKRLCWDTIRWVGVFASSFEPTKSQRRCEFFMANMDILDCNQFLKVVGETRASQTERSLNACVPVLTPPMFIKGQ